MEAVPHALEVGGVVGLVELGVFALQADSVSRLVRGHHGVALAGLLVLVIAHANFCSFSLPQAEPTLQSHGIGMGGVNPHAA